MKGLCQIRVLEALCKATKQWGMFISIFCKDIGSGEVDEICKAAPYLKDDEYTQMLADGCGVFLFDTEEEMEQHYYQTVGDDGPTKTNPYDGPARVYAITCDNTGQTLNENT
jgi:hypothetical protein